MKILHTSDWHLGQEFYAYDRTEEHRSFLEQIREIVSAEQPHVMVVSGDIYHTSTPSNTVMKLLNEELLHIHNACPQMRIVVTAGNHDSSSRLEVTRDLWDELGVDIIGKVDKKDGKVDYGKLIIPVAHDGEKCGYVVALPHVYPSAFPLEDGETAQGTERMKIFMEHLGAALNAANSEQLPVVMMAHMAITGSDITGHDQTRGGMDYINLQELSPVDYDYLALGHIHCPQYVGAEHKARYCGTPVPVSFDEAYGHSVTLVEIAAHGAAPQIRTLPITNPWPIRTVPAEPVEFQTALEKLDALPDEKCYVRLNVLLEDVAPANAQEQAAAALGDKQCRFCCIKWNRKPGSDTQKTAPSLRVEEFTSKSPLDLAKMYYAQQYGSDMPAELVELFQETAHSLKQND